MGPQIPTKTRVFPWDNWWLSVLLPLLIVSSTDCKVSTHNSYSNNMSRRRNAVLPRRGGFYLILSLGYENSLAGSGLRYHLDWKVGQHFWLCHRIRPAGQPFTYFLAHTDSLCLYWWLKRSWGTDPSAPYYRYRYLTSVTDKTLAFI